MNTYKAILTKTGITAVVDAINNTPVNLSYMGIGDANGVNYTPTEDDSDLVNEVYEVAINRVYIDPRNNNLIIAEGIIPEDVGDFTIREVSLKDENKNVLAIASYPEIPKPSMNSGAPIAVVIVIGIEINNTGVFNLTIDYSTAMVTKFELNEATLILNDRIDTIKTEFEEFNDMKIIINTSQVTLRVSQQFGDDSTGSLTTFFATPSAAYNYAVSNLDFRNVDILNIELFHGVYDGLKIDKIINGLGEIKIYPVLNSGRENWNLRFLHVTNNNKVSIRDITMMNEGGTQFEESPNNTLPGLPGLTTYNKVILASNNSIVNCENIYFDSSPTQNIISLYVAENGSQINTHNINFNRTMNIDVFTAIHHSRIIATGELRSNINDTSRIVYATHQSFVKLAFTSFPIGFYNFFINFMSMIHNATLSMELSGLSKNMSAVLFDTK